MHKYMRSHSLYFSNFGSSISCAFLCRIWEEEEEERMMTMPGSDDCDGHSIDRGDDDDDDDHHHECYRYNLFCLWPCVRVLPHTCLHPS